MSQTDQHTAVAATQAAHPAQAPVAEPATPAPVAERKAMSSVLIAIAILTLMDAGVKLWTQSFGTPQILVMRYGAGVLVASVIVAFLLVTGRLNIPSLGSVRRGAQRSVLVVTVAGMFFYALSVIPLAEATAIAFTAPIYVALLGWVILKEPVAPQTWLAIAIGFLGVAVISSGALFGDGAFAGELVGYICAAIAALAYAGALVLTRLHAASDPVPTMIMLQSGFSALFALPFLALTIAGLPIDGRPFLAPDLQTLLLALGIGTLGTVGHLFMAYGFKHAKAARLGPMEYTSLVWAALYGYVFFAEVPGWRLAVGCALIVAGTWIVMKRP
ncbi:MAG: DMT family transporter [Pseudomonadota bacterium]